MSHTPGPWTQSHNAYPPTISAGPHRIAQVADIDVGPECLANADLIAAAPDLLEALKGLEQYLTSHLVIGKGGKAQGEVDGLLDAARSAIAKAEGGAG